MSSIDDVGIYQIEVSRASGSKCYYIGQTVQFSERRGQHLRALRACRHDNARMQRQFSKYGEASFSFSLLLVCAVNDLTELEQSVLDRWALCYGDRSILNVMRECVRSHAGVKRRQETITRMSLSQKGKKKPPEHVEKVAARLRGRKMSEEARAHLSSVKKGRAPHPNSVAALAAAKHSSIRIERISAGKRASAYVHSEETKRKIAQALTGRKQSAELIEKRIAPLRGRKRTNKEILTSAAA